MAVRDDRSDVKQTTTGFRGPLIVQSLTSAKSKFLSLSLNPSPLLKANSYPSSHSCIITVVIVCLAVGFGCATRFDVSKSKITLLGNNCACDLCHIPVPRGSLAWLYFITLI